VVESGGSGRFSPRAHARSRDAPLATPAPTPEPTRVAVEPTRVAVEPTRVVIEAPPPRPIRSKVEAPRLPAIERNADFLPEKTVAAAPAVVISRARCRQRRTASAAPQ